MRGFLLLLGLAACGPAAKTYVPGPRPTRTPDPYFNAPMVNGQPQLDQPPQPQRDLPPVKVEVRYWPQPDLTRDERYFKVQDQYGCWWWLSTESKYNYTWIVLENGVPKCTDQLHAPEPISRMEEHPQ